MIFSQALYNAYHFCHKKGNHRYFLQAVVITRMGEVMATNSTGLYVTQAEGIPWRQLLQHIKAPPLAVNFVTLEPQRGRIRKPKKERPCFLSGYLKMLNVFWRIRDLDDPTTKSWPVTFARKKILDQFKETTLYPLNTSEWERLMKERKYIPKESESSYRRQPDRKVEFKRADRKLIVVPCHWDNLKRKPPVYELAKMPGTSAGCEFDIDLWPQRAGTPKEIGINFDTKHFFFRRGKEKVIMLGLIEERVVFRQK